MRNTLLTLVTSFLIAAAAAAAVPKVQPPNSVLRADLTIAGDDTPYQLANPCAPGESAITFRLTVTNRGAAPSPAINDLHAVWVEDTVNPAWSGGSTLPAIPPGGSVAVAVGLVGLKDLSKMTTRHMFSATVNGAHKVAESSYANNLVDVFVFFPPGFCAPPASRGAAPPPVLTKLPAPSNLTYTVTQAICFKYGGNAGALACSIGLPAGKLVLVWDYPPNIAIDGYRIYAVGNSQPVATQSLPSVRLEVLDPPKPGTCFEVTAFRGKLESPHSPTSYCAPR